MKDAILTYLKTAARAHVRALVITGVVLIAGRSWLAEHDARLTADGAVKTAQLAITDLQKQQTAVAQTAKVEVIQLREAAAQVKTTPEAIAALPSVTPDATDTNPAPALNAEALPDAPGKVSVDAVPLYQDLNVCKQNAVSLNACTLELGLQKQIDTQKDVEIVALKKKPGFWHRVKETAITVGIGAGIGAVGYAVLTRESSLQRARGGGVDGWSRQTVTRMFEEEKGVLIMGRPGSLNKRKFRSIRIPRHVYERVIGKMAVK